MRYLRESAAGLITILDEYHHSFALARVSGSHENAGVKDTTIPPLPSLVVIRAPEIADAELIVAVKLATPFRLIGTFPV